MIRSVDLAAVDNKNEVIATRFRLVATTITSPQTLGHASTLGSIPSVSSRMCQVNGRQIAFSR